MAANLKRNQKKYLILSVICLAVVCLYGLAGVFLGSSADSGAKKSIQSADSKNPYGESSGKGEHAESAAVKTLRLFLGRLSRNVSESCQETVGDERMLSLLYERISDVADISVRKNPSNGHAVYTIALRKRFTDTSGKLVTQDTLIYNYYLRCGAGNRGFDGIDGMDIEGLAAYRYGCTGKKLRAREEKVDKLLQSPPAKLEKKIRREVILPILRREYAWVEAMYMDPSCEKICRRYPEPSALFAHFYAINTSYQGAGKSKGKVIHDIAVQYGGKTRKLTDITGESYRALREGAAIQLLYPGTDGKSRSIPGIRRVDDRTIEIETEGCRKKDKKLLESIYLVTDSGDDGRFPAGTGQYLYYGETEDHIILTANPYWERRPKNPVRIEIKKDQVAMVDCVQEICEDKLDIACVWERLPLESENLKKAMEQKEASWQVAATDGVVYHAGRVNATTVSEKAAKNQNVNSLINYIQLNE